MPSDEANAVTRTHGISRRMPMPKNTLGRLGICLSLGRCTGNPSRFLVHVPAPRPHRAARPARARHKETLVVAHEHVVELVLSLRRIDKPRSTRAGKRTHAEDAVRQLTCRQLTRSAPSHKPRSPTVLRASAPRISSRRRQSATSRACAYFALFSTFLVVCGPIAKSAHFVLVSHTVCEHGELVHGEASSASTHSTSRTEVSGGESDSHGSADHEHCATASQTRASTAPTTHVATIVLAPGPASVVLTAGETTWVSSRSILSRAPKTSPPLV
jgi:hypothetical protein